MQDVWRKTSVGAVPPVSFCCVHCHQEIEVEFATNGLDPTFKYCTCLYRQASFRKERPDAGGNQALAKTGHEPSHLVSPAIGEKVKRTSEETMDDAVKQLGPVLERLAKK